MDVEFLRHQFEDGHDGVIVKHKLKVGVRHLQAAYMVVCGVTMGALRGSTGPAVLALARPPAAPLASSLAGPLASPFAAYGHNDTRVQIQFWDGKIQGAILSSFLCGYALMVVPAELLMRRMRNGGKHLLTAVLVVSGALAVAMPTIVKKGGWIAMCNAQLWMGVVQACLTPANQALLTKFLLPYERSFVGFFVHSGPVIGILIGLPVSGMLSESWLGWELIFYSQAMLALSVGCMWGLLTASTPDKHEAMGDTEKEFIKEAMSSYKRKVLDVPWRNILRSREFWVVICAHAASNTLFVFFLFNLPLFLMTFGVSLRTSTMHSLFPFIALLMRVTTEPTINWILRTLRLSFQVNLTYLRKLINAIGACGVVAGLTILPSLTPSCPNLTIVVLMGVMAMIGLQLCGFLESYKDMSENYHGSLLVASRAAAALVAAPAPLAVAAILGDDCLNIHRWRIVFLSLASLYVACNVVYTALGSSDRQRWDGGAVIKDKFGYHNAMIESNQVELEELSQTKKQLVDTDDTASHMV